MNTQEIENQKLINENIAEMKKYYKFNPLPEYDKSVGGNLLKLVRNIPTYLKNKKIISSINKENDYFDERFLNGFVKYNERRNSIRLTLRNILNPKYRDSIEAMYLNREEFCSYWIKKYYNLGLIKSR